MTGLLDLLCWFLVLIGGVFGIIGGIGIVTVLSEVGADSPGVFHAPSGELLEAFDRPDTDVLHHDERSGQASVVFRRA